MSAMSIRRALDAVLILLVIVTVWRMVAIWGPQASDAAVPMRPSLKRGDLLRLPGIEWSASRNMILVLSSRCPACNANLPFYQQLAAAAPSEARLLVVTAEATDVVAEWLNDNEVHVRNIHQVDEPSSYGLMLTPMVILTDADGRVTDLMIRRLDQHDQERILERIRNPRAHVLDNSQQVRDIVTAELATMPDRMQVVDVRSREQYRRGHRPAALNIPIEELGARAAIELELTAPVVIDCLQPGGGRCRSTAWVLVDAGFSDVSVLIR